MAELSSCDRYSRVQNLKYFIFQNLFILRVVESVGRGGAEREERKRILTKLCTVSAEPDTGLNPLDCGIMT